jgi:hypothetical protein
VILLNGIHTPAAYWFMLYVVSNNARLPATILWMAAADTWRAADGGGGASSVERVIEDGNNSRTLYTMSVSGSSKRLTELTRIDQPRDRKRRALGLSTEGPLRSLNRNP